MTVDIWVSIGPKTLLRVPPGCAGYNRAPRGAFRFSVIRFPPRNSALLTVGLPAQTPDLDGVTAFRTHERQPGWVPSIPRGRRCSPRPIALTGPHLPHRNGASLYPTPASHPAGLLLHEASTRVQAIHPSGLPLARSSPGGTGAASAFPRASNPADEEPDDARRGGDRPSSTDPKQRLRHQPNLQSSVFTRDVRPRVARAKASALPSARCGSPVDRVEMRAAQPNQGARPSWNHRAVACSPSGGLRTGVRWRQTL